MTDGEASNQALVAAYGKDSSDSITKAIGVLLLQQPCSGFVSQLFNAPLAGCLSAYQHSTSQPAAASTLKAHIPSGVLGTMMDKLVRVV